ncbi:metallophosphoesterase [Luteolibacter flavescens]|uniref:Metallophosphoesterase n=1 Tax=Luteolibacter flavescens TaxID=1859460 RepID=A0ABT3FP25_9BACT|nr:metallophosphoesterase [Luteolibacter flavescens]MCW1885309.1 metallophosphoesterase [Luteolibacter flavescens]
MSIFVIGDIHGYLEALDALLGSIPIREEDVLIFLGDYVNKGPHVREVLNRLVEISARPNTVFLRGNHDQMLLDAHLDPPKYSIWESLAGDSPLASYGDGESGELIHRIPESHWDFLGRTCVDFFETGRFIFVHAGIRAHLSPAEEDADHLHWLTLSMAQSHLSNRLVVCGHSAQATGTIADLGHTICIDTGITKGKFLTCLELDAFNFWQASQDGAVTRGKLR